MSQPWDYIAKLVCIGDSGTGKSSLTIRLCEGRFSANHDVTIGVECGSRIVPVGPPASLEMNLGIDQDITQSAATRSLYGSDGVDDDDDEYEHTETISSLPATATKQMQPLPQPQPQEQPQKQNQKHMKLSLWDTAGQETYKSITRSYFRGASGALLVFDITRPATFKSVTQWLQDLRHIADEDIIVVLVGNKSDLVPSTISSLSSSSASSPSLSDSPPSRPKGPIVTREEAEAWCKENDVSRYVETSAKSGEGVERAFIEVAERIYRNIEKGKYDLNDRRSGVKGYGITRATAGSRGSHNVNLRSSNALNGNKSSWTGDCC
ncbi:hypothetical protein KEM54_006754 [Ascosphaera aggregata]|nr:hypothetical protein KEM54_006754 [Ascosphaera aggregata]